MKLAFPRLSSSSQRISTQRLRTSAPAFTLIELLVVIAIIALLAAMVFPIVGAVNRAKARSRGRAELQALETAIEAYKAKFGVYPPSDTNSPPWVTPLFYELSGTKFDGTVYTTIDGRVQLANSAFSGGTPVFGKNIGGLFNCARGGDSDERQGGVNFLKGGLKPGQYLEVSGPGGAFVALGTMLEGPGTQTGTGTGSGLKLTPWCYNSANPTNNPSTFDLWIDLSVSGKTNRICNWSREPLIVN